MVFSPQMITNDSRYMMENNDVITNGTNHTPRKDSINSTGSTTGSTISDSYKAAVKCTSYDSLQQVLKLSLPLTHSSSKDDISDNGSTGATNQHIIQKNTSRQSISTGCLAEPAEYNTCAKVTDHFPQKVRTPSLKALASSRSPLVSSNTGLSIKPNKAPVATVEDNDSPDSEQSFGSEGPKLLKRSLSSEDSDPKTTEHSGNEITPNKIRFLPAYRAKNVEEMMQDRSPKAVWQHSTKSVHRSQSTRSPNVPALGYYSNTKNPAQTGRIYSTPPSQHNRLPYGTISRSRPSTTSVRINDGTHPRMPMRAIQPQTFHGVPVRVQPSQRYGPPVPYENNYGTARRGTPYGHSALPAQNHNHKAHSHGDMRNSRGRLHSDTSSPTLSQVDGNIRGANSEPDMDQPRTMPRQIGRAHFNGTNPNFSIPSGTYVASSSMTSLPQYAQLMPPSGSAPQRAGSAGNVRRPAVLPLKADGGTRLSYSVGAYPQRQPQSSATNHRVNSYDDVFNNVNGYNRGNITPTSPVSRQPSYLTAMSDPVRQRAFPNYGIREENGEHHNVSSEVVLRNKPSNQTEDDAHQKILRRTSYLMATSKPEFNIEEGHKTPNQKYRKLKKFFGEATPPIREAVQNAGNPAESFTLPDNLEVQKTGILGVKILNIEGKRSHTRSWRGMGAVLSRDMLYLVKDKKENATMLTTPSGSLTIDEKPISIIACFVAIAHSYTKKRHVFKLITATASEYLLQAEDDKDMVEWIKAIEVNRHPDKESEQLTSAELVKRINDQQTKLNQQKRRTLGGLSFKYKQPYASPSSKSNDTTQKKDKKKGNSSSAYKQLQYGRLAEPASGDFGTPIHECVPSHENEFVPLIVELCSKAIEDRGLDFVGIYRVPGNKAAVELLKKELNEGIINLDDDKWRDMNVLSSLLKTFFRRLPESLITSDKYKQFIQTNRLPDARGRLLALKQLIRTLPDYNFETLKYLALHLRKVAEHGEANKMDTRNLAIVFGPTIIRSGEDVMSLVTDMSDQCRIIESIIIYCDWVFSPNDSEPPALDEAEITSSCAPISETMNNLSADINLLANNKNRSKAELMSAFTAAANKNISKASLQASSTSPVAAASLREKQPSPEDDHGFKNRDLQQEVAARNQKLQEIKEKESIENKAWRIHHHPIATQIIHPPFSPTEIYAHHSPSHHMVNSPLQRWHSEESVLVTGEHHTRITHDQYPYHADYKNNDHVRQLSNSDRLSQGTPPPPIPARGENPDIRPPLPPKPMQLFHAKPTQIDASEAEQEEDLHSQVYENYEHLHLEMREPAVPQRTLRIIHNPLKSASLPRRGSLDSMMDTLEPFPQYSSSSSTESQDGSDLLSSITATFDQKLKLLVDPKFRLDGQGNRRPKTSSDSSSMGSSVLSQRGMPDSPSATHPSYRCSADQSRESLHSILSNKENMHSCESFSSTQDMQGYERGCGGSTSSLGSAPYRSEAKVGIASRIERKDIKPLPLGYPMAANVTKTRLVNATGSVILQRNYDSSNPNSDDSKDFTNNNSCLNMDYDDMPLVQRHMSDEKKRIRRRHTVGGAQDFELFKDMLSDYKAKQNILNEANAAHDHQHDTLTAWQRLQPRDVKEPLSLRDWIERERCRASSPELEMHTTPNIMHFQRVGQNLPGSLLESNT